MQRDQKDAETRVGGLINSVLELRPGSEEGRCEEGAASGVRMRPPAIRRAAPTPPGKARPGGLWVGLMRHKR